MHYIFSIILLGALLLSGCREAERPALSQSPAPKTATSEASPTPPPEVAENELEVGVSVLLYRNLRQQSFKTRLERALDDLAGLGIRKVNIVFPIFQDSKDSNFVHQDAVGTPTEEKIVLAVKEAQRRGFSIGLRPLLDPIVLRNEDYDPGHLFWRGEISPSNLDAWFASYEWVVGKYAKLAEDLEVQTFSVGVEMNSLEKYSSHWTKLIEKMRQVFSGELEYSTNWDVVLNGEVPKWFGYLDRVGVDAYFPLSDLPDDSSVSDIERGWGRYKEALAQFRDSIPKGVSFGFGEVGTTSQENSFQNPLVWDHTSPINEEHQKRYYKATCLFVQELYGEGVISYLHWWAVEVDQRPDESAKGFNPLGKPAELEMGCSI